MNYGFYTFAIFLSFVQHNGPGDGHPLRTENPPQNAFKSTGGGGVLDLRRIVVDSGSIPECTHQSIGKRNNSLQSHPKIHSRTKATTHASLLIYQHLPQGCCLNPNRMVFLRHPKHHPFSRCNYTNSWWDTLMADLTGGAHQKCCFKGRVFPLSL